MTAEYLLNEADLGPILVRRSARSKHYKLAVKEGRVIATLPALGREDELLRFIEASKAKLLAALQSLPKPEIWDESTSIRFATFRLRICRIQGQAFQCRLRDEELLIGCPTEVRFADTSTQEVLRRLLKSALRHEAKRCLPVRLAQLAQQHGFRYTGVTIKDVRSCWGSCSSRKHINLSLSLMKLPWHLIDYVLLHELCHTVEMNHSDRFWALMNKVTDGKALQLRGELKRTAP